MASQKRKSIPMGHTAKRQKLDKDLECPSVKSKKTSGVSNKSKTNQGPTRKKTARNASMKPNVSGKKAIKKPPSKSAQQKTVQKRGKGASKTAKTSSITKVPLKKSPLKIPKEVSTSKKSTKTAHKSLHSTSKASKKNLSGAVKPASKRAVVRKEKTSSEILKKQRKGLDSNQLRAATSEKKQKCIVSSKKSARHLKLKSEKSKSKIPSKSSKLDITRVKTRPSKNSASLVGKILKNKVQKVDLRLKSDEKSGKVTDLRTRSTLKDEKPAQISKMDEKDPKENCKKKRGKQLSITEKKPIANKVKGKKSDKSQPHSSMPPLSKKKTAKNQGSEGKERKETVGHGLKRKTKVYTEGRKTKSLQENLRKSSQDKKSEKGRKHVSASTLSRMGEKNTVVKIDACTSSSPGLDNASVSLSKKTSMKEKHPKPIALSAQSSTKRTMICMKAKDKLKRQKIVHSGSDQIKQALPSTDDHKVKRVSILDLCNEIAGEIESDTVEVKKDVSSPQSVLKEGSVITEMKTENTESAALHPRPTEESPVNTSKRFFPSKNPLKIKCKLDRKLSPALKNSKWTKIKLKKANNFSHNNVMRNHAVLPSLDMINVKSKVSQIRQPEACTSSTPRSLNKLTDKTLPVRINISKPNLPELKKTKIVPTKQKKYSEKSVMENGLLENHIQQELEIPLDEGFRLHLDSSPESTPVKISTEAAPQRKIEEPEDAESKGCVTKQLFNSSLTDQMAVSSEKGNKGTDHLSAANSSSVSTDANIQKEVKKLKEAEKDSNKQPIIDAGQKRFGAISCNVCGMLYTASNPEDETQHLLFHNQFISAVKYVGWKKERIVAEYPDGKIIMVLPDDPKYALRKVKEVREMVDNDLGFQQAPLRLHSRTKTLLFISNDKKVVGCLIAEHIQWGYRVIDDLVPPDGKSEKEQALSERVKAWCCSTTPEPAICGISRIWVFSMKRRKKIASRMLECLRSHFIYGSYLNKDEIAFSDPTPDGKLFATHYCGTSQFLVYNFVNGHHQMS